MAINLGAKISYKSKTEAFFSFYRLFFSTNYKKTDNFCIILVFHPFRNFFFFFVKKGRTENII